MQDLRAGPLWTVVLWRHGARYDLFDEDVLSKLERVAMYAHDKQFLYKQFLLYGGQWAVLPLTKYYTKQIFVLLRTRRMQLCNHADKTQCSVPSVKRAMREKIAYRIKFGMLQVRENEISLRK